MDNLETIASSLCFGGEQLRLKHSSEVLACDMHFSVFLPSLASQQSVPVLYWLSGLTCTDENFVTKAGAQRYAQEHGMAIVMPDTSPRGEGVPDDPDGAYDFGLGAGFYVNATQPPWQQHFQMYDYIVDELPKLVTTQLPIDGSRSAISGHSMGGHGALTIGLRNPENYQSISAFAPICSPIACPWGQKALSNYLGTNQDDWTQYDASLLVGRAETQRPILVDQGDGDDFLDEQLKTQLLASASKEAGYPIDIRMQPGYDHSYFFIATFIGQHLAFHARHLGPRDV